MKEKFGYLPHEMATFDSIVYCDESLFYENNDYIDLEKWYDRKRDAAMEIKEFAYILNLSKEFLFNFFEQYHIKGGTRHAGKPEWCFNRKYNKEILEQINAFLTAATLIKNS